MFYNYQSEFIMALSVNICGEIILFNVKHQPRKQSGQFLRLSYNLAEDRTRTFHTDNRLSKPFVTEVQY